MTTLNYPIDANELAVVTRSGASSASGSASSERSSSSKPARRGRMARGDGCGDAAAGLGEDAFVLGQLLNAGDDRLSAQCDYGHKLAGRMLVAGCGLSDAVAGCGCVTPLCTKKS